MLGLLASGTACRSSPPLDDPPAASLAQPAITVSGERGPLAPQAAALLVPLRELVMAMDARERLPQIYELALHYLGVDPAKNPRFLMATALSAAGARVTETADGLTIHGTGGEPLPGGANAIATHLDHRIAMSFALFNILVLVSRTSNSFLGPFLAKRIELRIAATQVIARAAPAPAACRTSARRARPSRASQDRSGGPRPRRRCGA